VKLSVIIPCYNEKNTIEGVLKKIRSAWPEDKEIIVVDDCSSDGTRELLQNQLSDFIDKLILHNSNHGKGKTLRTGFSAASGDILLVQDADFEYEPDDYRVMLAPILEGKADVVFGSRFLFTHPRHVLQFHHYMANKLLTFLTCLVTNLHLTDMETCYKAFKRSILDRITLREDRFGFEPEFTCKVANLNVPIYEVPIRYNPRTYAEGKKIGLKDGLRAIYCILKYGLLKFH